MQGSGMGLLMYDGQLQTNWSLPSCVVFGEQFVRLMPSFEFGIIKVFTMMMNHCHQSKGIWNEPMIGQHIANA